VVAEAIQYVLGGITPCGPIAVRARRAYQAANLIPAQWTMVHQLSLQDYYRSLGINVHNVRFVLKKRIESDYLYAIQEAKKDGILR